MAGRLNALDFLEVRMVIAPAAAPSLIAVLLVIAELPGGLVFLLCCRVFLDIGILSLLDTQRTLVRQLHGFRVRVFLLVVCFFSRGCAPRFPFRRL
jgi:hypothetical protein